MKLYVVGFGPGNEGAMTAAARAAIGKSDIVVGYTVYAELMKRIFPDKEFITTPMRGERERVTLALDAAASGKTVSLVCSGDSGVYGMAALALELSENFSDIEIVPGVTAALSGGALLGAPLTNDFAVISLSDLLTPRSVIEQRLRGAAAGGFVIVLYNPASSKRRTLLSRACDILLEYRAENTVCGMAKNIGREGETTRILTLEQLKSADADMFTTVFIGNDATKIINGKMVTSRGYKNV